MYVPGLPYLTALWIRLLPHVSPDTIYRTIVSLATCLGPVTLFFFALVLHRQPPMVVRRGPGLQLALALLRPVPRGREGSRRGPASLAHSGAGQVWRGSAQYRADAAAGGAAPALSCSQKPRLSAHFRRGGGPGGHPALTNWVGAFALAISSLLLLLAAWGEPEFRYWRALAAAGLAYLLACFWLTPSFIKTIAFNWPVDSFAYHLKQQQVWLLAGMIAGALAIRAAFRFFRGSFYFCLVTMGAFVFGWIATVFYVYGLDTIPESRRYAIEFEFFVALALVEALRLALRSTNSTIRLCAMGAAGVMLLVGAPQLYAYATQGWQAWRPSPPENTLEYRLGEWMAQHPPQGRVFASGGMRFRLNSWFDLQQVGGGFETGLQNRVPYDLSYDIRAGTDAARALLELKALGAQYVVIHGPRSREYYRDFQRPERIAANLPAVYHIEDDTIYALPPRPLAHLATPEELTSLPAYVAGIEDPSRPVLQTRWLDAGALDVTGPAPRPGDLVSIQVNATPGWRASQDNRALPIAQDRLGFIVLTPAAAPPATHIALRYHGTLEQRLMAALCVLSWLAAFAALRWGKAW